MYRDEQVELAWFCGRETKTPPQHLSSLQCRQESRRSSPQYLSSPSDVQRGAHHSHILSSWALLLNHSLQAASREPQAAQEAPALYLPLIHNQTWSPFLNLQENQSDTPHIPANSPTPLELPMAAEMATVSFAHSFAHMLSLLLPQPPLSQSQLFGLNCPSAADCFCGSKCWS